MNDFINNNDRQKYFNQIRGVITEIIPDEKYCSITIEAGHENVRPVNLSVKKVLFDEKILNVFKVGDKISARFYLTSNKSKTKAQGWHTSANVIDIFRDTYDPKK